MVTLQGQETLNRKNKKTKTEKKERDFFYTKYVTTQLKKRLEEKKHIFQIVCESEKVKKARAVMNPGRNVNAVIPSSDDDEKVMFITFCVLVRLFNLYSNIFHYYRI